MPSEWPGAVAVPPWMGPRPLQASVFYPQDEGKGPKDVTVWKHLRACRAWQSEGLMAIGNQIHGRVQR